ncbi:MAG: outer membrane protein assembly factor BamA [Bdellovibrionales bacterium]
MIFLRRVLFFTIFIFYSSFAYGVSVYKISIKGSKIIEKKLIHAHLQLKINKPYSTLKAKTDVKNLSALGFFDSVEVYRYSSNRGMHVVYKVKERPFITQVEFKGADHVSKKDLEELSEIKTPDFLNLDSLYKTFFAIQEKYKKKGYFFVKITHSFIKKPKSQKVKLVIKIKEKEKTFIKKINFIGNLNLSDQVLKSRMLTKEKNIISFLGSSGVYNPENLSRDISFIEYLYRDKGYLNIRLEKPEISISPDQKGIYINLTVLEGPRFQSGELDFQDSDQLIPKDEVLSKLSLKKGRYFSLSDLQKDLNFIKSLYKNKGYAFAQIHPKTYFDPSGEDKVHILYDVNKGKKYKVDQVFIKGNFKTRDKVILRRLYLREGTLYQESKQNLTKQLLQQLGFFEEVNLRPEKSQKKGWLNMYVDLKERETTGEAQLAGGYNGYSGLFIRGGIKKNNFLGLDQSLSFQVNFNRYEELFNFNYMNPYFLDTAWSFGFDLFNFGQDLYGNQQSAFFGGVGGSGSQRGYSYSQSNVGFSVSLGRHLDSALMTSIKYRLQKQSLSDRSVQVFRKIPIVGSVFKFLFGKLPDDEQDFTQQVGFSFDDIYPLEEGEGLNSSLSGILEYKKANDYYYPTKGYLGRISLEYAGLGGDFHYTKLEGKARHYKPLFWKFVLKNSFQMGWVFSNSKNKTVPFTELFLLGGPYNLRGYQFHRIGPHRFSQKAYDYAVKEEMENPRTFAERPYGGEQMIYYSLELEFPLLNQAQLKGAVFLDIGEANKSLKFDIKDNLRMNAGLGIRWRSPFGPLNIDVGFPYKPRTEYGENRMELQFGINPPF